MSVLIVLIALALIAAVIFVVSAPLRKAQRSPAGESVRQTPEPQSAERHELEVAREAKYREIRDAELDYRTGKLSREDYEAVDGALRTEAVEILNRLEGPAGE
jgi:uncharacterized protein (DUF58 family)